MKSKKEMEEQELDNPEIEDPKVSEEVDNQQKNEEDSAQKELAEQKDKFLRLSAEFENYKRRTSKEFVELRQTAGRDVITSLLEVLDDIDRAEEQMKQSEGHAFNEGVVLIFNKFRKILESKGLKAIETLDTDFDVEKDEAVSEVPAGEDKVGKVVAEVQKGYTLNDKLIRFAKVVVGK